MPEYLQREADGYTMSIVELIIDDPCISAPRILQRLVRDGACGSEGIAVHLFGGPGMFRRTRRRLEVLRWVLVTHEWEQIPFPAELQYREWEGQRRYFRKPDSNDDWVSWWAPDVFSATSFEEMEQPTEEMRERCIYRFPAGEDEEAYFANDHDEWMSLDSDVEITEAE